jgi:hypothetical protein
MSVVELMLQFNTGSSQFIPKSGTYSSSKFQFSLAHACKLILNLFMSDKSMMRSAETYRLLQECLLDIVVDKLEKICGLKKKSAAASPSEAVVTSPDDEVQTKPSDVSGTEEKKSEANGAPEEKKTASSRPVRYKLNKISHQDEIVQLLKLLSEVIRISNDHQQHLQSM